MNAREQGFWVFHGAGAKFAAGVFVSREKADSAIRKHRLTGVLTWYPSGELVYDWASREKLLNMKPEKSAELTAEKIGQLTTASQPHFHYEDGELA